MVYEYRQDDPKKCTAARLRKFGLVEQLRNLRAVPASSVVLNPIADNRISREDRTTVENSGLVGLDCSWNRSEEIFPQRILGTPRRLPALLAGNPTNYAVLGKLSTAEALAAALFITGFTTQAHKILSFFKWGATFLTLNKDPLEAYAKASLSDLPSLEAEFFNLN
jgi:pre-rRNA-processing protein TSR3